MPDDPGPTSVILGKRAVAGSGGSDVDQFIGRVDLPNDADQYLDGTGAFSVPQDKDWDFDATNVWTGTGSGFPSGNVGIGVLGSATTAKLDVNGTAGSLFLTMGINVLSAASTAVSVGLQSFANGASSANYGARNEATASGASANFGTYGNACNATNNNYSIYGEGCSSSSTNYAGYFNGNVTVTGTFSNPSDENLKSNIQPISNAAAILDALNPVAYEFTQDISPLNLPEGNQYGLIAQQLGDVLPELVVQNVHPAKYDSLGNEISPSFEYLSVRYTDLIPILIAGYQQQNFTMDEQSGIIQDQLQQLGSQAEVIADLQTQVENLQQQMASMLTVVQAMQTKTNNCCNDGSTGSLPAPTGATDGVKLMQNVPNPFDTNTRIDFILPSDANAVLELSDAQGRPLRRLVDGQMNAGSQSIVLDGSSLAPGTYFYTVYANGEMITKKMVKR